MYMSARRRAALFPRPRTLVPVRASRRFLTASHPGRGPGRGILAEAAEALLRLLLPHEVVGSWQLGPQGH